MMLTEIIRTLYAYDAWANQRILETSKRVRVEQVRLTAAPVSAPATTP
jgi:hypothetical protein